MAQIGDKDVAMQLSERNIRGVTLFELLIALSILAILLAVAVPSFSDLVEANRRRADMHQLMTLVQMARHNAVTSGSLTQVCATPDYTTCTADWTDDLIVVFVDSDNDREIGAADTVLKEVRLNARRWHWRASASRPYLRFRPDGSAIEWGAITRCPSGLQDASQLVLNRAGRAYLTSRTLSSAQTAGLCN